MAGLPKLQWAQVFEKHGGPIELKQIPVPTPGPDEILVNIKYTGGERSLYGCHKFQ
jgi:propanol-preferring alcohol dehydrogenase